MNKVSKKQDIFTICAAAAAAFVVDSATISLDNPIPESSPAHDLLDGVIPWIPTINLGQDEQNAIEIILKKEVGVSNTSQRTGRSLREADRRRLDASIPHDAHRGLRMLRSDCSEGLLDLGIACPIDTSAGEFFCAQMSDIRLDASKIVDLVRPIINDIANENDGTFDAIAKPLLPLETRLPGISDVAGEDVTILDIAEISIGPKSGAGTVRKVLSIYRSLLSLADQFNNLGDDGVSV